MNHIWACRPIEFTIFEGGGVFEHATEIYEADFIGGLGFIGPFCWTLELVLCAGSSEVTMRVVAHVPSFQSCKSSNFMK